MAREVGLRGRMDIAQFNSNVQSFMKSIRDMNKEVARVAKESSAGAKSAGDSAGFLGVSWQRVKDIVTGVVIIQVFRAISNALKSVAADAVDAVSKFQTLQITLQAILARDFAREFGVPVAQALKAVTDQAQELLMWVRRVAVTTPFSVESLASALAYGQAFGFNVAQSKRLTLATGEFVAGMGLTNEHMQRIIYNFGQMLASGRVLGRELRDLANNFVPIRDITQLLADEAGVPFEEMKKAMKEARVSAEQFIGAFVRMAETSFPGAMERMARTIAGVKQNISDFIRTLIGLELLGPMMARIAEMAASALDKAFSPGTLRAFAILGQTLLFAFNQIVGVIQNHLAPAIGKFMAALGLGAPTAFNFASAILYISATLVKFGQILGGGISSLAKFVNDLSSRFGATFAELIQRAAGWGFNVIRSLAEGMARAIVVVVQVLSAIAKVFTYWLSGHSPPKLLPELGAWGKAAMESWLSGWTSADFGIFNEIANIVSNFIRSLAHEIPQKDLIPRILGARAAIESAIDDVKKFGEVTEGSLNKIFKAIKITSGPLREFIRESFEFAAISALIGEAKKVLEFDFEFPVPVEILGETVDTLEELIQAAGRFKGELGAALQDYARDLLAVEQANKRVAEAQKFLNDITEKYDDELRALRDLQEQFKEEEDTSGRLKDIEAAIATGLLTDEEKRRLELEREQILLENKISALERERDTAVDTAQDRLEAERKIADEAEKHLELQRRLTQQLADEQLAAAKEQLEIARAQVQMQIDTNNLIQEQVRLLEQLAKAAAAGAGEPFEIPGLDFEGFTSQFEATLEDSKQSIIDAINDLQTDIVTQINTFISNITAPFAGIPDILRGFFADIGKTFEAAKDNPAIQAFLVSIGNFFGSMSQVVANLRTFWDENGEEILGIIGTFFSRLTELIKPELAGVLVSIGLGIEKFGEFLVTLSQQLVGNGPEIQASLQSWVDWVFEEGIPKLQDFGKTLTDDIVPAIVAIADILIANGPLILAVLAGIAGAFLLLSQAKGIIELGVIIFNVFRMFQLIAELAAPLIAGLGGIGGAGGALAGIMGTLSSILGPLILLFIGIAGVIVALKTNFGGFKTLLVEAFGSIREAIEPAFAPLKKAFKDLKPVMAEFRKSLAPMAAVLLPILKIIGGLILTAIVPAIVTVLALIVGLIRGILTGITFFLQGIKTMQEGFIRVVEGIKGVVEGIVNFFTGIFTGNVEMIKEGFSQLVKGLNDIIGGFLVALYGQFKAQLGFVIGLIGGFVEGVIKFFITLANRLIKKSIIPDMLSAIILAFVTFFADTVLKFGAWILSVIETIISFFDKAVQTGKDFVQSLLDGITDRVFGPGGLIESVGDYIQNVIDTILSFITAFLEAGKELIRNLLAGIREIFESAEGVYETFKTFMGKVVATILEFTQDFVDVGKKIIEGIIQGLIEKAIDLYNTIKDIIEEALKRAGLASKTESPSKIMKELGGMWMIGFTQGLVEQASATEQAIFDVFSGLASIPAGMQLTGANTSIQSVLDKLAELSDFESLGKLGASVDVRHLFQPQNGGLNTLLTQPSPSYTNIRTINVEVNPTYATVQSEAGIYYDVRAALAHMSR